jgi:hypothetical protein
VKQVSGDVKQLSGMADELSELWQCVKRSDDQIDRLELMSAVVRRPFLLDPRIEMSAQACNTTNCSDEERRAAIRAAIDCWDSESE